MKCRHCHSELRLPFLDLATAPPSNAYLDHARLAQPEIWYPLRLLVCETCWLVQTEDYAGRESLFTEDYAYFSSFSTSWLQHAERYVQAMIGRFGLNERSRVVEIAANDGYLLQYVQAAGIPCIGIEPTASTAAAARARGIDIIEQFFGVALAWQLVEQEQSADLIVANNVLAHVPDINDFVAGIAHLLKPSGVATCEFPHLLRMIEGRQFDTAYHEHYSYLSLSAVQRIFTANGLEIFDVEELGTHGGSLRVFAQRPDAGQSQQETVARLLAMEKQFGLLAPDVYRTLQPASESIKLALLRFLLDCRQRGETVAAYGAAAKGNTLLNFSGIRGDLVAYVADRNPDKQNKFLPGSRIPIVSPEHLLADRPPWILLLPWNLHDEIIAQLAEARQWGARFVTAIPELWVLA
ncbi:MAG: class I SAM-dependent methyltransferase [Desulfobulbus sp.]|nr:class I SAM-dependent methyltransferase [Desulfobulbus sp.]